MAALNICQSNHLHTRSVFFVYIRKIFIVGVELNVGFNSVSDQVKFELFFFIKTQFYALFLLCIYNSVNMNTSCEKLTIFGFTFLKSNATTRIKPVFSHFIPII